MLETGVFIIESLSRVDEDSNHREGKILTEILNLCGIPSKYRYIRTKKELIEMMNQFIDSNYRYLHISCHGNDEAIALSLDYIKFIQLKSILDEDSMLKRRLFLSSCNVCNNTLAKSLEKTGCLSIVGPRENIGFSDAAIFWSSFYNFMLKENDRIASEEMKIILENTSSFFNLKVSAFIKIKGGKKYNYYEY